MLATARSHLRSPLLKADGALGGRASRAACTGAWRPGREVGASQGAPARRRERTLSKRRETQLSPGLVVLKTLPCSHQPIPRASAGLRPGAQTGRQAHEVGKFFLWRYLLPFSIAPGSTQLPQVCGLCIWLHPERRRERLDLGISAEQEMSCACEDSVGAGARHSLQFLLVYMYAVLLPNEKNGLSLCAAESVFYETTPLWLHKKPLHSGNLYWSERGCRF
uniref:uncharacterized protein LOC132675140 n=1 Tax=Panthera onca TaxID=9690 RepID=UPI0029546798|nr:uncharacterized protein LOC132675140 [Panthera onca]